MKHKAHRTNLCHCSFCCTEMCLVGTLWGWELEGKEGCPSEVFSHRDNEVQRLGGEAEAYPCSRGLMIANMIEGKYFSQ